MIRYLIFFIFLILVSNVNANNKEKIIENLQSIDNLNFNFEQNINGKIEIGNCTIQYPKKIYCKYTKNNKILVSDGKILYVGKKPNFHQYALKKTPLNLLLDKKFLVEKINKLDEEIIDNAYINFQITENNNQINIFFDRKSFNLIGWQTKDVYQNVSVTYLSSIKENEQIDKNLFKSPKQN
tara:strand:- start:776 stop:1321 length:546 start_codon:yes stop_codon:yes gene_type:complete